MSESKKLWIKITGIDMDLEVWQLLHLFFDDDSFAFINEDMTENNFIPGPLLNISVSNDEEVWLCEAEYYQNINKYEMLKNIHEYDIKPLYSSKQNISNQDLKKPGGRLFESRKIIVGTCIVKVLSKVTNKLLPYGSLTGVRPVKLAMQCIEDGLDKQGTINQLVKATAMSENKAALLYDVAVVERPFINIDPKSIHLYIGIPFCVSRCLYCSFTSYPMGRYKSLIPRFLEAIEKEIRYVGKIVDENNLNVKSVYIGGGTPTALDNLSLNRVLNIVNESFNLKNVEFTLEAGRPDTITQEKLYTMKMNNITRISINPQTMNSSTLKAIGRNHTPEEIIEKFGMARETGFDNINMDIIAGLPNEDEKMFRYTLEQIEKLAPDSITVHTMAVKRASILHDDIDNYIITPDNVVETMIEDARLSAKNMNMKPYYLYRQKNILANLENTGYAKEGYECLYNIHTMEEVQSIIAMGAGAISKFVSPDGKSIKRTCNVKEVAQYIDRIDEMLERKKVVYESL
ncbi:MAG: coproporphyrinogen dehydrogenase HemZ [Clostridiaceae bacterium]|nr:coproporphyrinogen dehydrogenase HemZ [Clostridiaceae bacterium]